MTNNGKVKHVFPGGNTTVGFYSFYDQILPQDIANHIYVLKGGPGVGKSSFMKKIGKKITDLEYQVEYHHCSSDPNSLDALVIPKLKVAFIDGTSPHIVDPINPGAVDEILNLGQYWDEVGLKQNKGKIIETNNEIKRLFDKAYQYLKASKEIYDSYEYTERLPLNTLAYNQAKVRLIDEVFTSVESKNKIGKERHLFAFALTPIGITEYRDTIICDCDKHYLIKESIGASSEQIMYELVQEALRRGLDVECYHSPIKISKFVDIIIPEINTSISIENDYQKIEFKFDDEIDLTSLLDKDTINTIKNELKDDKDIFEMLLYKALNYINKAKSVHDKLEEYYIPNMNFNEINKLISDIVNKILRYA